jgi:hypothetical protein
MPKALGCLFVAALFLGALCVAGCSKPSNPAGNSTAAGSATGANVAAAENPVVMKLQELAGSGATNCGDLKSQATDQMQAASQCAMQAAKEKHPFYVAYELPGMNVALAGNSDGKLFTVQSQAGGAGLTSGPCPAELRVAPSGRLTCYAPGTFPMGAGAGSHTTMSMPPMMGSGGANPHKGLGIPAPGSNPHQQQPQSAPPAKHL